MSDDGGRFLEELMRFKPDGLSPNGWAVKAGVSRTIWNDLKRHGNPSRRTLEKLLKAAETSLAEFEALRIGGGAAEELRQAHHLHENSRGFQNSILPPIPLIECLAAGEWGKAGSGISQITIDQSQIVDWLPRPSSLARDQQAFAVTIVDEAMWPRFRSGRRVAVSPAAPVNVGDDVLLVVGETKGKIRSRALVKELTMRTPNSLTLRQFTPDKSFELGLSEVKSVHRILGELI